MKRVSTPEQVKSAISEAKNNGQSVGFVPTMGALHNGHMSLIQEASKHADFIVCSIFVNPTQFGDKNDLDKYPRTIETDCEKLEAEGCHLVFLPEVEDVYPPGHVAKKIDYHGLDKVMEGAFRPGHFDGVVEVVSRLFDIVEPNFACFGEKDFQQLAVIRQLVDQLNYDISIIPCPIIREAHGLAMSSRNERLSAEHREYAAILNKTLLEMRSLVSVMNPDEVAEWGRVELSGLDFCELEYLEVAESKALQPIFRWHECTSARAFVVARFGEVRLIDNLEIYRNSISS